METLVIGDRVNVIGRNLKGKVMFFGQTHFTIGNIYGVMLDQPKGKHNGTVGCVRYFHCPQQHGLFARASQLEKDNSSPAQVAYERALSRHKASSKRLKDSRNIRIESSSIYMTNDEMEFFRAEKKKLELKLRQTRAQMEEFSIKSDKLSEELDSCSEELQEKKNQILTAQDYLGKLKTYIGWLKRTNYPHSRRIKKWVGLFVDLLVLRMGETLGSEVTENDQEGNCKGDSRNIQQSDLLEEMKMLQRQNEMLIEAVIDLRKALRAKRMAENAAGENTAHNECYFDATGDGNSDGGLGEANGEHQESGEQEENIDKVDLPILDNYEYVMHFDQQDEDTPMLSLINDSKLKPDMGLESKETQLRNRSPSYADKIENSFSVQHPVQEGKIKIDVKRNPISELQDLVSEIMMKEKLRNEAKNMIQDTKKSAKNQSGKSRAPSITAFSTKSKKFRGVPTGTNRRKKPTKIEPRKQPNTSTEKKTMPWSNLF